MFEFFNQIKEINRLKNELKIAIDEREQATNLYSFMVGQINDLRKSVEELEEKKQVLDEFVNSIVTEEK